MELKGTVDVPASSKSTFDVLTTPDYLLKTMPGLKSLTPRDDGGYDARLEMGIAAIKGTYTGTVRLDDVRPGQGYRLLMEGEGPIGFINLDLAVSMEPADAGTVVAYEGQAHVGGTAAGVGQRMLSGVAKLIVGQFFSAVKKEAKALG